MKVEVSQHQYCMQMSDDTSSIGGEYHDRKRISNEGAGFSSVHDVDEVKVELTLRSVFSRK